MDWLKPRASAWSSYFPLKRVFFTEKLLLDEIGFLPPLSVTFIRLFYRFVWCELRIHIFRLTQTPPFDSLSHLFLFILLKY